MQFLMYWVILVVLLGYLLVILRYIRGGEGEYLLNC